MKANRIFAVVAILIVLAIILAGVLFGTPPSAKAYGMYQPEPETNIEYFPGFGDGHCLNPQTLMSMPNLNPVPCDGEAVTADATAVQQSNDDEITAIVTERTPEITYVAPPTETTVAPTPKPELPTPVVTEKPELPPVPAPTKECKNPQDGRDDNIGDCNAGDGND